MINFYNYIDLYIIISCIIFALIIVFTLFSSINLQTKQDISINKNNDVKRKYFMDKFTNNNDIDNINHNTEIFLEETSNIELPKFNQNNT